MTQRLRQIDGNGYVPQVSRSCGKMGHLTETDLDEMCESVAEQFGLMSFHVPDSRRVTARGWPDRVYLGPHGVLFRELKSEGGTLTRDQRRVGYRMQAIGLDWAVWRPLDLRLGRVLTELEGIA